MPDLAPLVSHDAIASLTPAKKKSLLAAVAKELGKEWKAEPVDDALGLPLLHVPTKLRFRLIPGGSFTMGLTADDVEQCEKYVGGMGAQPAVPEITVRRKCGPAAIAMIFPEPALARR